MEEEAVVIKEDPTQTKPSVTAKLSEELVGVDDDVVDGEEFEYVIGETVDEVQEDEEGVEEEQNKPNGDAIIGLSKGDENGADKETNEKDNLNEQASKGPILGYSHGFGAGAANLSKEVIETMKEFGVTIQNYASFSNQLGRRHTPFEIDLDSLEEKNWRKPGATLDDFFNFGFNEQSWREYAAKQVASRLKDLQNKNQLIQANEEMQQTQQAEAKDENLQKVNAQGQGIPDIPWQQQP